MKNFTKNIGKFLMVCFSILLTQTYTFAQGTCATAVTLTPGTQQCGDTSEGGDTFDDNACLGSYDGGDDYLFEYTVPAGNDGQSLQLDLTSSGSWTGIAISEGCPEGGGGTCFGAATSSAGDESLLSDPLTGGNTYYIHISTWPSPQSVPFCLDAAFAAPPMPPANDLCSSAEVIVPTEAGTCVTGTNDGATDSGEASPTCAGSDYAGGDIWYAITVPSGQTQLNYSRTASDFSTTYYALYSGDCNALVEEDCGTSTTDQFTGLTSGDTYYLRLFDWGNNDIGDVTFCIAVPAPPPANDACGGAISIASGGMMMGSTASATNVEALTPCEGGTVGPTCDPEVNDGLIDFGAGVWYVYNSPGGETITIEVDGFDTELQVFSGGCGALMCVAGDDDSNSAGCCGSQICFESPETEMPTDYYIYVDGHNTSTGNFTLTLATGPLPVELISFEGKTEKASNMLMWKTASEENTEWHIIERSINGRDGWQEVDRIAAAGYSYDQQDYMLEDKKPMAKAYYRLRSVDFDLSENVSEIIYLERRASAFDIVNIFPNPTKGGLTVDFEVVEEESITITLTDMLGQTISNQKIDANAGVNTTQFDMNGLATGVYFINIANATGQLTKRVLKN